MRPFSLLGNGRLLIDERASPAIHGQLLAVLDHRAFFALERAFAPRSLACELRQFGSAVGIQALEVEIELAARPITHAELALRCRAEADSPISSIHPIAGEPEAAIDARRVIG
ncbi:MAG: hypothetical protein ABWZ27_04655 [Aestuariivirgaceae bacterium]